MTKVYDKMTVAEIREKHGAFMDKFGRDVKVAWPTVYALLECLPSLADEIERMRAVCEAAKYVHDRFKRDLDQGYQTKDKVFAVEVLGRALGEAKDD